MTITDDNKMVVMFDLRWHSAYDQSRIDPGVAISNDGGHTWTRKTAWSFYKKGDNYRRTMDPTLLYNNIDGSLYALHGTWSGEDKPWYAHRLSYFVKGTWAATLHKSIDGGLTWTKVATFDRNATDMLSNVQFNGSPVVGFLGGVGTGIVMHDGTLVFPIQTAHLEGIATTLMYSKDNGKTWHFPKTNDPKAANQSSLENMVFELEPGKLVMTGRESRVRTNQASHRWAYISADLGKSWKSYPAAEFGKSTAQPTQGSSIYVTLPSGRRVLLVSKPDGNNDSWSRGNLSLYALDPKTEKEARLVVNFRPNSGNKSGAGYSSLAYKEGNLFVAFEDDGDITVKNLTGYVAKIEKFAEEWNLPNEIEIEVEKINKLPHLNQAQKDELIAKMRRANDNAIAQSFVINRTMGELKQQRTELDQKAQQQADAVPSKLKQYQAMSAKIAKITQADDDTFLDYNALMALSADFTMTHNRLSELDFSQYIARAKQFNQYNTDILYHSFNKMFVHYDISNQQLNLALGLNRKLENNVKTGLFFSYGKGSQQTEYQLGTRANYKLGAHQLSGFVRYRANQYDEVVQTNHNLDGYVNYAYGVHLTSKFSLAPSVGLYLSGSAKTSIDEDVIVKPRLQYGIDVAMNFAYQLDTTNVFVRPTIALVGDHITLAQSNFVKRQHNIGSSSVVYGVNAGVKKQFANGITFGTNVKMQAYSSRKTQTLVGIDVNYRW